MIVAEENINFAWHQEFFQLFIADYKKNLQ
jgi:hypothetical protein